MSDGFAKPDAARRMARLQAEQRRKVAAAFETERSMLAEQASVIRRKVKPLAQIIDERLNALRPSGLAQMHGSAALHFRLLHRRRRASRQEIGQDLDLGSDQTLQGQHLSLQECDMVREIINGHFQGSSSDISNNPDANPADPVAHRLCEEPS